MVRNVLSARKMGENAMTEFFTQFATTGADVTDPNKETEDLHVHQPAIKKRGIKKFQKTSVSHSEMC